jgi:hypothetical protein
MMEKSLNLPRKCKEERKLKLSPIVADLAQLQDCWTCKRQKYLFFLMALNL